jgi:hypothetical protein
MGNKRGTSFGMAFDIVEIEGGRLPPSSSSSSSSSFAKGGRSLRVGG